MRAKRVGQWTAGETKMCLAAPLAERFGPIAGGDDA